MRKEVRTESAEPEEAAKTAQRSKEKVAKERKNGKNFTRSRIEGANRKCETVGSGRKFTAT